MFICAYLLKKFLLAISQLRHYSIAFLERQDVISGNVVYVAKNTAVPQVTNTALHTPDLALVARL